MAKVGRVIFILVVLALLFIPTIIAMKYVAIAQIYSYFTDQLASLLGVNMYLIRAAVVLAMVPFLYALKLFLSFSSRKRQIGAAIMTTFVVFYNVGLYFATNDQNFTFQEGKVMRWYAITPDGVKFYDRAGVDPSYGIPLKPVTPDVIRNLKMIERGDFRTVDPAQAAWFNPITGDAQLWYSQDRSGILEFYNKPGYHPFTKEPLKPVTQDVYYNWKERSQAASRAPQFPSAGVAAGGPATGKEPPIISPKPAPIDPRQQRLSELKALVNPAIGAQGRAIALLVEAPESSAQQALYSQLKSDRVRILTGVFRDDVFRRGLFEELYQGDSEMVRAAASTGRVDWVVLGKLRHSFRKGGQLDSDLISCEMSLTCKVLSQSGDLIKSDTLRVIGPGFSEAAALDRAAELLAEQLQERVFKPLY